jgi:predicted ThiF/HesA family dinucleotide-utilizing enzyme
MAIPKHPKTLLVIVAEAVLEKSLIRDARERGAQSWSVAEVHGAGREGVRDGDWEADRTVELKVLCDEPVADTIAAHVLATYAPHYSVVMYFSAVAVLRPERY